MLPSIPKVRVLTEHNTRQGFFDRPDLEAVVAALPAYLTGWRKGSDRDAGAIRPRPEAAETGRGRTVMLEGDLAELIDRWGREASRDEQVKRTLGLVDEGPDATSSLTAPLSAL